MRFSTIRITNLFFCIILVLSSFGAVSAGISDDVSTAIANGIELTFLRLTNAWLEMTVSTEYGTGDPNTKSIALDAIISIATYTPDPFGMPLLQEFQNDMKNVFYDLWWLCFLIVIICVLFALVLSVHSLSAIHETTGFSMHDGFKKIALVLIGGVFVLILENAFIWCVLVLCSDLSKSIMMGSLNAIAFTPDNIVLYIVMSGAYGLLFLCFAYRSAVIMFFFSTSFIFGVLLFVPSLSNFAWKAHLYFIQLVFYQLAVILWYTFCIVLLQIFSLDTSSYYIIMVLVSVWLSYRFIFHLDFVRGAGLIGRIVLFKKL